MHKALIETFVITGARKEEINGLNLNDVNIKPDVVWIRINGTKTLNNFNVSW